MKFDQKLVAGIFVGLVAGLHYHASLMTYLPIFTIVAVVLILKTIHR